MVRNLCECVSIHALVHERHQTYRKKSTGIQLRRQNMTITSRALCKTALQARPTAFGSGKLPDGRKAKGISSCKTAIVVNMNIASVCRM